MSPDSVTNQDLVDFVVREARLLDEQKFDEWNALFADDGYYWIPLTWEQPNAITYTSHAYDDKLLRDLRIQRLSHPRTPSHQSDTRCQHVLQTPWVEERNSAANEFLTRTPFQYTEFQLEYDGLQHLVGTAWHHLKVVDGALRITLKRVNLLNSDGPLTAFNLFV